MVEDLAKGCARRLILEVPAPKFQRSAGFQGSVTVL